MKTENSISTEVIGINRAIPDWGSCRSLVLVYPLNLYSRKHLVSFYDKFINQLANDILITIIVKNAKVERHVLNLFHDRNIKSIIIAEVNDIWIRDWAPLCLQSEDLYTSAKFIYSPTYFKEKDKKYAALDHSAGIKLGKIMDRPMIHYPNLILDIGNLTHNGAGIAIISNRFISDNETSSINYIKYLLNFICGFYKVIFVPVEPGDITGHVDGMVRFVNRNTLVIGSYPVGSENASFLNNLADSLREDLGEDYNIIRLLNTEPEDYESEGIGSAGGNHINFLRIEDKIYFPYYNDEISGDVMKDFISEMRRLNMDIEVIPVNVPEINDLARKGGVLNCMTWQVLR